MKIKRTIPPAMASLDWKSLAHGFFGLFRSCGYLRTLERELQEYFGVKQVFLASSGKTALTLILTAQHALKPGRSKVVIPAYTCFSVPSAIVKAGLKVSLCDVDETTFDYDLEQLGRVVDNETLCVVTNNLFGIPSRVERISEMCKSKDVPVVEDAAQAMGGRSKGRLIGSIGDAGFFSLGRGKNITCGSGGIIVTNSDTLADQIRKHYARLPVPGFCANLVEFLKAAALAIFSRPMLYWFPSGLPFLRLGETIFYNDFPMQKLSGMQAGLMRGWRRRLETSNKVRSDTGSFYARVLGLQRSEKDATAYLRMPVMMKNRHVKEILHRLSREDGLGITGMYPAPVSEIKEIRDHVKGREYPKAKKIAQCLLTLPTHHLLTNRDRERICRHIKAQESILPLTERALKPAPKSILSEVVRS